MEAELRYSNVSSVISGDIVYAYFYEPEHPDLEYDEDLVAFDKYDGTAKWVLDGSELPVSPICAISDETIYVAHDDELVALRELPDEDEGEEQPDEGDEDDESDGEHGDDEEGEEERDELEDGGDQQDEEDDCPSDCPDDDPADGDGSGGDDNDSGVGDDDSDSDSEIGDDGTEDETDDESGDAGDGSETDETDAGDEMPGFTTGAGLAGGAATLVWLRRRADVDDEPAE